MIESMKIATFNVNGVNKRLANLLSWLGESAPDVVCLQELKATDAAFPRAAIAEAGYGTAWLGESSWNGVAILARGAEPIVTQRGLPGDPGDLQSRYIEAAVGGVLIASLYLPNGNPQPGPKFAYKLAWFERLLARARTQIRKRRYTDHLRDNVQNSIEMAITDALTGLHNRRYMESHLGTLAEQAASRGKPLALMMLDIDFFKSINDNYGHDAGDDVLREFAVRVRKSIRGIDLACRYGGEEFVIVMPETDLHVAGMVAERLRRSIAGEPFAVNKGTKRIEVTISIGLSTLELKGEAVADVLKRADTALYRAKHDGRNRVVAQAA